MFVWISYYLQELLVNVALFLTTTGFLEEVCYTHINKIYINPSEVFINLFPPFSFQGTLVRKISVWHQKAQKNSVDYHSHECNVPSSLQILFLI